MSNQESAEPCAPFAQSCLFLASSSICSKERCQLLLLLWEMALAQMHVQILLVSCAHLSSHTTVQHSLTYINMTKVSA